MPKGKGKKSTHIGKEELKRGCEHRKSSGFHRKATKTKKGHLVRMENTRSIYSNQLYVCISAQTVGKGNIIYKVKKLMFQINVYINIYVYVYMCVHTHTLTHTMCTENDQTLLKLNKLQVNGQIFHVHGLKASILLKCQFSPQIYRFKPSQSPSQQAFKK